MKYLKNKAAMTLCCGFPIFGLLGDGIAYLVTKGDTNLHPLPPFFITIIFIVLDLPLLVASLQFVELTDSKIINYLCNIKTFEIELSDIKQWDCYNNVTTSQYSVTQSTPFIYISTQRFESSKFDFTKLRKYKYIKSFPYDNRLKNWLEQNVPNSKGDFLTAQNENSENQVLTSSEEGKRKIWFQSPLLLGLVLGVMYGLMFNHLVIGILAGLCLGAALIAFNKRK